MSHHHEATMTARCMAEFVGSSMIVFTAGCNVLSGNVVWGGMALASVVMVAVYSFEGISGAHFNPAVSMSLGIVKHWGGPSSEKKPLYGTYVSMQMLAGMAAGLLYVVLYFEDFNLAPAPGFGVLEAGICEVSYTFMLCFVLLNVRLASGNAPNQYFGLAIGYVYVAGSYGAGLVSGGFFNPAITFGIDVSSISHGFGWSVAYCAFQAMGAFLAAVAFRVLRPEDFGKERSWLAELLAEAIGTFMVVLTVGLNVLGRSQGGAFSIAASVMCMMYAVGDISGGHFNPAITIAVFLSRRCPEVTATTALKYIAAQLFGGVLAAATYSLIYLSTYSIEPGPTWAEVGFAETVFTSVLCFVYLCVVVSQQTRCDTMFGLAVGMCMTVGSNGLGAISGGALNPAVCISAAIFNLIAGGGLLWVSFYVLFHILGAVLAAMVFTATHAVDVATEVEAKTVV